MDRADSNGAGEESGRIYDAPNNPIFCAAARSEGWEDRYATAGQAKGLLTVQGPGTIEARPRLPPGWNRWVRRSERRAWNWEVEEAERGCPGQVGGHFGGQLTWSFLWSNQGLTTIRRLFCQVGWHGGWSDDFPESSPPSCLRDGGSSDV